MRLPAAGRVHEGERVCMRVLPVGPSPIPKPASTATSSAEMDGLAQYASLGGVYGVWRTVPVNAHQPCNGHNGACLKATQVPVQRVEQCAAIDRFDSMIGAIVPVSLWFPFRDFVLVNSLAG